MVACKRYSVYIFSLKSIYLLPWGTNVHIVQCFSLKPKHLPFVTMKLSKKNFMSSYLILSLLCVLNVTNSSCVAEDTGSEKSIKFPQSPKVKTFVKWITAANVTSWDLTRWYVNHCRKYTSVITFRIKTTHWLLLNMFAVLFYMKVQTKLVRQQDLLQRLSLVAQY